MDFYHEPRHPVCEKGKGLGTKRKKCKKKKEVRTKGRLFALEGIPRLGERRKRPKR